VATVEGQEAVMGAEKVAEEELLVELLMLPVVLVLSVLMVAGVVLLPGALGVVVMVVSLELHCSHDVALSSLGLAAVADGVRVQTGPDQRQFRAWLPLALC